MPHSTNHCYKFYLAFFGIKYYLNNHTKKESLRKKGKVKSTFGVKVSIEQLETNSELNLKLLLIYP